MELRHALSQALTTHKTALLACCHDLVRSASENPPGHHYRACTDRLALELDRLGLAYRVKEAPGFGDLPRLNILGFRVALSTR
jgi:hypothetical protein